MANKKSSDILKGALRRAGEVTNGNSKFKDFALESLNAVYLAFLSGSNEFELDLGAIWPWALSERPKVITLLPPIEDGSVSLTKGSSAAVFSTAPTVSVKGHYLKVEARPEFFLILAHNANETAFTLDVGYTENTSAAINYKVIKLDYSLGDDVLRIADSFNIYREPNFRSDRDGKIYGIDLGTFRKEYPMRDLRANLPDRFAEKFSDENQLVVTFNGHVDKETKVDIEYIPVPEEIRDDAAGTIFPNNFVVVLEFAAAFYILTEKNDKKATDFFTLTQRKLKAMSEDKNKRIQQVSKDRGKLLPRQEQLRRRKIDFDYHR